MYKSKDSYIINAFKFNIFDPASEKKLKIMYSYLLLNKLPSNLSYQY